MSLTQQPPQQATGQPLSDKEQHLLESLHAETESGTAYIKSKFLANQVNLSSKEIGSLLKKLSRHQGVDLTITQWANSPATTWRIDP